MAALTEIDVLFELMLPLFLEHREASMKHFRGTVFLSVRSDPPRTWTLTGGARPWLKRGHDGVPDLEIAVSERLVTWVLADAVPDPDGLIEAGDLGVRGDPRVLDRLGATWAEAQSLIATLAKGPKPRR